MNLTPILRVWRVSSSPLLRTLVAAVIVLSSSSCGSSLHLIKEQRAQRAFQEARELGAEEYAPYEFYAAQTRISEAKRQAAAAEYGTAAQLSQEASVFAEQAIAISKNARSSPQPRAEKAMTE